MKKILLCLCALLLLAGCSDAHAKLTDSDVVIVTVGDQNITKDNLFTTMKQMGSGYSAISSSTKIILENEVPVTDELRAEADASLELYRANYKESFPLVLQSNGFKDEEDFYNNSLLVSAQLNQLTTKYVNDNFDSLIKTYKPKKAVTLAFATEEDATAAKADLENGIDGATVGSTYNSSIAGAERILTTSTELDENAKSHVLDATANGVSDVIIGTAADTYYVVNVIEFDPNNMKDEVIDVLASLDKMGTESDIFYFNKYGFKVYDRELYDNLAANYSDYLPK